MAGHEPLDEQGWAVARRRLRAFVAARLDPPDAVEDVVQDVLTRMVQHLDHLDDATRLDAWAYRIARNALADEYRRRARTATATSRAAAATATATAAEQAGTPSAADAVAAADLVELSGCLRPLVRALDEPYRSALETTTWGGLTQADAAARAGVSLPGMKSRVQRARTRLREQLLACCEPEPGEHGLLGRPTGTGCATATPSACGCTTAQDPS